MSFKLSQRSLSRLEGVHPSLLSTVEKAIQLTKVDFGCSCGVRTIEEQKVLLAKGASTTMKSKHLIQEDGIVMQSILSLILKAEFLGS